MKDALPFLGRQAENLRSNPEPSVNDQTTGNQAINLKAVSQRRHHADAVAERLCDFRGYLMDPAVERHAVLQTGHIGLALRDFIEGQDIVVPTGDDDNDTARTEIRTTVEFIDLSDPDNPVIHLSGGQTFRCVIVAVGP